MNNPDKIFKDKLYHLETPLGGDASFEKVMAMRKKDAVGIIWWKPALLVLSTLSVVSVTGYFWFQQAIPGNNARSNGSAQAQVQNSDANSGRNLANDNKPSESDNSSNYSQTPEVVSGQKIGTHISASADHRLEANSGGVNANPTSANGASLQDVILVDNTDNSGYVHLIDASGLKSFGIRQMMAGRHTEGILANLKLVYDFTPKQAKCLPAVELMMATGAGNIRNFDAANAFSVRGNHRFGQYTAVALWDLNHGLQLGAGIGYAQFAGNGEWRQITQVQNQKIDTQTIIIVQPGLPDQTITKYDTTVVVSDQIKTGSLSYNMSKFSVPIAVRYYIGEGRSLIRISGTIAPGVLVASSGTAFNKESYMQMPKQHTATLDARLGVGLYLPISTRTALVFEPGVTYQSVFGGNWQPYNRFGLGLGLGVVIKP